MASIINSIEEHPEYLYDHLIRIEPKKSKTLIAPVARCVAIDQFTSQIYVFICDLSKGEFPSIKIGTVLIYSQCGEYLRSCSLDMEDYALYVDGMAIHRNNVYIISKLSRILHFKVADSMSLISCEDDRGSGIGRFIYVRQLDISNEGDLYVADCGYNRVQILDGDLQYKRHISHHSMIKPRDVKLTPDEVYVLGDSPEQSNYCIHIFTYLGEKLRSIILNGIPNNMPWGGFCVDTRGNVAIIDIPDSQIVFLTKEGFHIETLVTLKEVRIFGRPVKIIGVIWITNQKLVVLSQQYETGLEIYFYI